MTIDGRIFLYIFILLFLAGAIFSLTHLYHAIRFGGRDPLSIAVTGVFVGGLVVIVILSITFLSSVDWSAPFDLTVPAFRDSLPSSDNLHF